MEYFNPIERAIHIECASNKSYEYVTDIVTLSGHLGINDIILASTITIDVNQHIQIPTSIRIKKINPTNTDILNAVTESVKDPRIYSLFLTYNGDVRSYPKELVNTIIESASSRNKPIVVTYMFDFDWSICDSTYGAKIELHNDLPFSFRKNDSIVMFNVPTRIINQTKKITMCGWSNDYRTVYGVCTDRFMHVARKNTKNVTTFDIHCAMVDYGNAEYNDGIVHSSSRYIGPIENTDIVVILKFSLICKIKSENIITVILLKEYPNLKFTVSKSVTYDDIKTNEDCNS